MAWYKTGTVAVTNASTTVTGAGTNFVSGAQVGDGFLGPNELLYEITAINSATSLTIAPAYGGATASSQSYAIAPTQGLVATLASDVTDLITDYQSVVDNAGAGKFGDGSAASPAIRFTNDQDTGFFRDTANEIAFATAGVKRGEFGSSGIQLLDSQKFIAGTGSDLQIYHDSNNSYIDETGTGTLRIRGYNQVRITDTSDNIAAIFKGDAETTLYHNNSAKLATSSIGVDITGVLSSDGLTVNNGSSSKITIESTNASGETGILEFYRTNASHAVAQIVDEREGDLDGGKLNFKTSDTSGSMKLRMDIDQGGDISFFEDTGTTPKMVWKSADERLGIGTSAPATPLHIETSGNTAATFHSTTDNSNLVFTDASTTANVAIGTVSGDNFRVQIASSERMRLDASGNLLVGKTSSTFNNTAGIGQFPSGRIYVTRDGGNCLYLNRVTSDGDIAAFYKDGSTVGSIGVNSGRVYVSNGSGSGGLKFFNGGIHPCNTTGGGADNAQDCGNPSARFDDVYATNGTIQTSDRNEKQDIAELTDAEQRVAVAAKGLLRKFRWKDAVAEKGDEARTHFGIIAQDLQAAFAAEGLDAGDYAMFISSTWTDEETGEERTRMGVRYSELLAFIIAAI